MATKHLNPIVLLLVALWIFWGFGLETVGIRLKTQIDGVVVSSRDVPPSRGPRYATEYILRGEDGRDYSYVAGPTDASLPRSMPVGTRLKKIRWRLDYERDGQLVDDLSVGFFSAVLGTGLACLISSIVLWQKRQSS